MCALASPFLIALASANKLHKCDYYLTQSKLEGAVRGIYAGRDFDSHSLVEKGETINVKAEYIR